MPAKYRLRCACFPISPVHLSVYSTSINSVYDVGATARALSRDVSHVELQAVLAKHGLVH